MAGLAQATDEDLYGTTEFGGANCCITAGTNYGCGTIFKIASTGTLTTLYNFCSQNGRNDGSAEATARHRAYRQRARTAAGRPRLAARERLPKKPPLRGRAARSARRISARAVKLQPKSKPSRILGERLSAALIARLGRCARR